MHTVVEVSRGKVGEEIIAKDRKQADEIVDGPLAMIIGKPILKLSDDLL